MIRGKVNPHLEAIIPLVLRDGTGVELHVEAVVDTGYNGYLSLPHSLIAQLGFEFLLQGDGTLADGSQVSFEVYNGFVVWDGRITTIEVDSVDGAPLVGMALLKGFDLHIRTLLGGDVLIETIP